MELLSIISIVLIILVVVLTLETLLHHPVLIFCLVLSFLAVFFLFGVSMGDILGKIVDLMLWVI